MQEPTLDDGCQERTLIRITSKFRLLIGGGCILMSVLSSSPLAALLCCSNGIVTDCDRRLQLIPTTRKPLATFYSYIYVPYACKKPHHSFREWIDIIKPKHLMVFGDSVVSIFPFSSRIQEIFSRMRRADRLLFRSCEISSACSFIRIWARRRSDNVLGIRPTSKAITPATRTSPPTSDKMVARPNSRSNGYQTAMRKDWNDI